MQFSILVALVAAVVGVNAQGSGTCFDDGDCFLSGGKCVKESGSITGTCSSASTTSGGSGGGSFPTGFPGGSGGGFPTGFPSGGGGSFPTGFPTGGGDSFPTGFPTGFKKIVRRA